MAFALQIRSLRAAAAAVAVTLLASMFVAVAAPAAASPVSATVAVDPAHSGIADRLPLALQAAAAVGSPEPGEGTAVVDGTVTFPDGIDLTRGRTFVVAYAPGADPLSPLASAAVAADGSYAMNAPLGDIVLGVLSEGRAVLDHGAPLAAGASDALTLGAEAASYDVTLEQSALVTGTVTAPVNITGQRVAVVVYPADGAGAAPVAANYVTDAGTYAVGGLPAGNYRIAFVSAAAGAASEWWDNAPGFAKAKPVVVDATVPRTGIDAKLETLRLMDTSVPTISGTTTVGQTLKAAPGVWTAGAALTYQWYANGAAIAKATASSLVLSATVAGKRITVRATGKKTSYFPTSVTSAATAAVVRPLTAPVPAVTGTATVGQTLKVKTGTWTAGTRLTYQWYISGVAVAKATAASFKIPAAAAVKPITVVVTGSKAGYATAAKRSKATAAVKGILSAPVPKITGSTIVGSKLTAVPYTWTSGTKLTYQWYRNGKAISRATGSTLVVTAALVKGNITVRVTGTKSGYITAARTSAKTAVVSYPARTKPIS
ncbi:MAG: hypothetical protein K0Q52_3424, partial [Microbacterium sp.]|nr:hypothetical protein [Microbacterium sp.]